MRKLITSILLTSLTSTTMALDINALWDHAKPDLSEQRFSAALDGATADDKLILQTQIARTWGLRRDFSKARELLAKVEPALSKASPEVRVRYFLELGRSFASTAHSAEQLTAKNREQARSLYTQAFQVAKQARLDALAIDALHMMVIVDPEPERQLEWNEKAVAYMETSDQADARRWEGSLRNNIGYAKHLQGDYEVALQQFRLSRQAHQKNGRVSNVRVADWMIAWTLRAQEKYPEALAIQLQLEREWDADAQPDPYVFEELEHIYRAIGDESRAKHYADRLKASPK